eukprot:CAMPEP_0172495758 /NCGR_PEP_ID=MMETSP1066-20121228/76000_1 /TAXON_ID=671091 /ORGANISM="Coscinodiscus wailesii, Strain CCMP2513" /LENGTH=261 /DNA_ID=CAMNT_0013267643 /DNA_START=94 /DNA_END=879 /DNA_ORIENTATION=-
MSYESTPLTPGGAIGNAGNVISTVMTKENAAATANFVKDKAEMLKQMATEGSISIRVLAFLGGVAMVVTSFLCLFGRFLTLKFVSLLICIYTLLFGILICALEGKSFAVPRSISARIRKYALFLDFVWGRGGLYFFAGSLQFSQLNLIDMAVGAFMCCVGVTYIIVGKSTAKKLSEMRKSFYTEAMMRDKFSQADINNVGGLNLMQFKVFTDELGLELNVHELHTAFSVVDKNQNEMITFEEFNVWWTQWDFDTVNAEINV